VWSYLFRFASGADGNDGSKSQSINLNQSSVGGWLLRRRSTIAIGLLVFLTISSVHAASMNVRRLTAFW
jgi:hypothetical protein